MSKSNAFHPRPSRLAVALAALLLTAPFASTAFADAADAHVPPPQDTPLPKHATYWAVHAVYGATTELVRWSLRKWVL